jgi:type 1 glutamine amidotransferase
MKKLLLFFASLIFVSVGHAEERWLDLAVEGGRNGKHVVIITGDEEYRSEESGPMLGKILSETHGFNVRVCFAIDPEHGYIDPNNQKNIPGLEALADADLMIISTRFRQLPDDQYAHLAAYLNAGKPVIGFRTATHAFTGGGATGDFKWNQFGLKILGEKWAGHHGGHKREGARGVVVEENKDHPILNGATDVFATSDVYGTRNLDQQAATVLLRGAVTETLEPDSKPIPGPKNDPMQALAWIREYTAPDGTTKGQAFCTTAGASDDFRSEGLRRLVINAALHLTGLQVPENADVTPIDPFEPTFYGFIREEGYFKNLNLRPSDFVVGKTRQTGLPGQKK